MRINSSKPLPVGSRSFWLWLVLGLVGLLVAPWGLLSFQPFQINLIHYRMQYAPGSHAPIVLVYSLLILYLPFVLAQWAVHRTPTRFSTREFVLLTAPAILTSLPLGAYALWRSRHMAAGEMDTSLDSVLSGFHLVLISILGAATTAYMSGRQLTVNGKGNGKLAVGFLLAAIAILTFVHVRIQLNFYNHFMLGHADIGHFTEELKNALAGRGLRSDSFENTRLGWHFSPFIYVLVPGYALWPSITYLMTLGPLVLHAAALPVYWFVRRRTDSVLVAWICAMAWLLLPSLSRLVYSNTYGFAWLYTSVPLLALLLGGALLHRWKLCWILVAVLLLSRETHAAITLGFGAYLALFTVRRRAGLLIVSISVAYSILCAAVIIPYFAKSGRYERLDIFGDLGGTIGELAVSAFTKPELFFGSLLRPQSLNFLLLLLAAMCFLPLRGWRLAITALPALLVHLLMENTEWISIKFWHHAMVLPILFFAALSRLKPGSQTESHATPGPNLGLALALLVSAACGHYFFGFSPLSKSYELYARDAFLQNPDPRLDFVEKLRREIPTDRTILATERLAAHFTDYKRVYTGGRIRPVDFVILDRSDQWDTSGLPGRDREFSENPDYELHAESGPIIVFARRTDAPPIPFDP